MEAREDRQSDHSQERAEEELRLQMQQGQDSQALLSNEVLVRFFNDFKEQCLHEIDVQGFKGEKIRQRAADLLMLSRKLHKAIEYYVENGILSEQMWRELIERKKTPLDYLKDIIP